MTERLALATEAEMREMVVPWPKSLDELTALIETLVKREHDYGTCVYAMSIAATTAFNYVAHELGVTGFQASCADLDIIKRTRSIKGPFRITDYAKLLYPQYLTHEHFPVIADLEQKHAQWLADESRKLIAESGSTAHPDVLQRWHDLADRAPASVQP
jgi:hypothetical protein